MTALGMGDVAAPSGRCRACAVAGPIALGARAGAGSPGPWRLVALCLAALLLSACKAETWSTVVQIDLMFPSGRDPLDGVRSLEVSVVSPEGEVHEGLGGELSRPAEGWDDLDVGVALGLVDLELAGIVLEGRDAGGVPVARGETIPVPLESGRPGEVTLFFQELGTSGGAPGLERGWSRHAATYLEGGGVLIAGGCDEAATDEVWVYAVDRYEPIELASLDGPRSGAALVTIGGARGLLLGGSQPTAAAHVYDPVGDLWREVALPPGPEAWPRPLAATLADEGVIALRGREMIRFSSADETTASSIGELPYEPIDATLSALSMSFVAVIGGGEAPAQAFHPSTGELLDIPPPPSGARSGHGAAVLSDGRLVLAGGEGETGPIADVEIFDPEVGQWAVIESLLEGHTRREATASALRDDRVLVAGGLDEHGEILSDALVLDLEEPSVDVIALTSPRWGHTATVLPTGTVLLLGGEAPSGDPLDSAEIVRPALRDQ